MASNELAGESRAGLYHHVIVRLDPTDDDLNLDMNRPFDPSNVDLFEMVISMLDLSTLFHLIVEVPTQLSIKAE